MVKNLEMIAYELCPSPLPRSRRLRRPCPADTRAPSLFRLGIGSQTDDLYKFDLALCSVYISLLYFLQPSVFLEIQSGRIII